MHLVESVAGLTPFDVFDALLLFEADFFLVVFLVDFVAGLTEQVPKGVIAAVGFVAVLGAAELSSDSYVSGT